LGVAQARGVGYGTECARQQAHRDEPDAAATRYDASVIRDYEEWLAEQLLDPRSAASIEMSRLAALARKQDLCLVCFCAPKACHADIIKRTSAAMGRG
jgi:hypothetical protein